MSILLSRYFRTRRIGKASLLGNIHDASVRAATSNSDSMTRVLYAQRQWTLK